MWKPHPYIYSIWLLGTFSLGLEAAYWEIDPAKNNNQQAHHAHFSLSVNIKPTLTSYATWQGTNKHLLIADIEQKSNFFLSKDTPLESDSKKWSLRLYVMDDKRWLVWKDFLQAQSLLLLQSFEKESDIVMDCFVKNEKTAKLIRIWLCTKPSHIHFKELSSGSFTQARSSPILREGGSCRFLYTLDYAGNFQAIDTLRGYIKKELSIEGAYSFEIRPLQEDPSKFLIEFQTRNGPQIYDGQSLQKR